MVVRTASRHDLKALKNREEKSRVESRVRLRRENYHKTKEKERRDVNEVLILLYYQGSHRHMSQPCCVLKAFRGLLR